MGYKSSSEEACHTLLTAVFFNLGSAEPKGSAKYLNILLLLFTYVKVLKKCKYCYAKLCNQTNFNLINSN